MSARPLYVIANDLHWLLERVVNEFDGEITEEVEEQLSALPDELRDKIDAMLAYRQDLLGDAEKFRKEEERLAARRKTFERGADNMKEYIRRCMEFAQVQKMDTERFKVWRQNNPPAVEVYDLSKVPHEYLDAEFKLPLLQVPKVLRDQITQLVPRTHELKDALKAKEREAVIRDELGKDGVVKEIPATIPGVRLRKGEHLRIK